MVEPRWRQADDADIAELSLLESLARGRLVGQRGGALWLDAHPAQHPDWGAVAAGDVIVATIDEVPVGYVRYRVDRRVVYVEDIFVHPGAREIGCGAGLLDAAIAAGRGLGAERIEAVALPGDRETKNLYERAGITAKRIVVSAPL